MTAREKRKAEIATVESKVYSILAGAKFKTITYNTDAPEYKEALDLTKNLCVKFFPELHKAVFGKDYWKSLIFADGHGWDFNLYYYNPDATAGGQIVRCPISADQVPQMVGNKFYATVLAENTQYLSDIDDISFFETIFELLESNEKGEFLGVGVDEVFAPAAVEKKVRVLQEHLSNLRHELDGAAEHDPSAVDMIADAIEKAEVELAGYLPLMKATKTEDPEPF